MSQMDDPRLVTALAPLFEDRDPRIRANACAAARVNWDSAFAPRLIRLLSDDAGEVRGAACNCLQAHPVESANYIATYRKMAEDGGVATLSAMTLLRQQREELPKRSLVSLFSSDDPCTIKMALWDLGDRKLELDEISPLLTNSLPMARLNGLVALLHLGDKAAMDRIIAMLRDPNEGLRWAVRTNLRRLSGKKLGPDPAAWEKWWAENRETFTPAPPPRPPRLPNK
jgi:HEAT repeat protein